MKNRKIKIVCISMLSLILFVYLTISINSYMNGNKIGFFYLRFYVMSSDLKGGEINKGDLVLAKSIATKDIKAGDKIIYKNEEEMLVKKVNSVSKNGENVNLVVDDDNGEVENQKNSNHQIIGKVVCNLAGLGNVALFLQSPIGMIDIFLITASIIIIISKLGKDDDEADDSNEEIKETEAV